MRRQVTSTSRENDRTASPEGSSGGTGATSSATTDSSTTGPPACSQRRNQVSTSSSPGALSRLSGHRRVVLLAAAQQPGDAAVALVPGRRPPGDHLGLRAGQRDVGQPDVVAGDLGPPALLVGSVPAAPLAADVEAAGVVLVEEQQLVVEDVPVEAERQVDEGVLQALAHPHGHDLHRRGVAVEPSGALGRTAAAGALLAQPVEQRGQPEPLAVRGLVEELGEMGEVGHLALAAAPGQHPLGHPGDLRRLEHRGDPASTQVVGPGPQRLADPVGEVVATGVQAGGGLAEEHRGRRRAHQPGAVRLLERLEQAQPVLRRLRGEDVEVAGVDGRDAGLGQRLATGPRVLVRLDDHRDVAGLHRRGRRTSRRRPAAGRCRRPGRGRCGRAGRRW